MHQEGGLSSVAEKEKVVGEGGGGGVHCDEVRDQTIRQATSSLTIKG